MNCEISALNVEISVLNVDIQNANSEPLAQKEESPSGLTAEEVEKL